MRSLLIAASVWAVSLVGLAGLEQPASPCLMPPYRPSRVDTAYLKAFHRLVRRPDPDRYDALILRQARLNDLDPKLIKAVIAAESGFNPQALSPAGARGLMQVMPATARGLKITGSLYDPENNVRAGAAYLHYLHGVAYRRYGLAGSYAKAPYWVEKRVVAAYNAGPRALSGRGWCRQTRLYANKVMFFYRTELAQLRRESDDVAARD